MIKFIKIVDFKCEECSGEEYDVIDLNVPICVCSKCGNLINNKKYNVEVIEKE
jgi:ribosomal protein L37AE/L43A